MNNRREALAQLSMKLADKYRDDDFANNPNGYTIAPYVNRETTSEAYEHGFTACLELLWPCVSWSDELLGQALRGQLDTSDVYGLLIQQLAAVHRDLDEKLEKEGE